MGFSAYLQSVIADYAKQRDRYILTDLQVEYREEKERSPDGLKRQIEKKVERLEVLAGLRKYVQKGQVLLVGKPGSGKSTALEQLRWELAQAALVNEQQPIPVLVALRSLRHNFGILEAIAFELQKGDPDLDLESTDIQRFLLKGRLFLLLDGVNEVPSSDLDSDVKLFRGSFPKTLMIFTSRELGAGLGIEQKLEICGLTERQMRSFVQNYLPDYAEVLLRQLKDRLRELAETPLLLKLLCDVFDPVTQKLPQSKGELFRAVDAKFNTWKQREGVRTAEKFWQWNGEILRYLAFMMLQADGTPIGKWLQIERDRAEHLLEEFLQDRVTASGEKAKDWLQDLLEHHLLQPAANPTQIEFHHQLFQEYYAAEYLQLQLPNLSEAKLKRDYLNFLKWTEPLAVTLSLVLDEGFAVQIVKLALEVDWLLGARLAGEVNTQFQGKTVRLINDLGVGTKLRIRLLLRMVSNLDVPELLKTIEHSSSVLCQEVAEALAQIASESPNCELPNIVQKSDVRTSQTKISSVAGVLKWIGARDEIKILGKRYWYPLTIEDVQEDKSGAIVTGLIEQLQNPDPVVRQNAARAVGKQGSENTIPELLKYLEHSESYVRHAAAEALGYIGSDRAVDGLLKAFNKSKPYKHKQKRKKISTLDDLFPDLSPGDSELRRVTAWALGRIGSAKAINALLKILDNPESYMRGDAAEALGYIGSAKAIEASSKALNDPDFFVRWRAARALGDIGSDKGMDVLMEAANRPELMVRQRAAESLANINSSQSINALIKALDDPDPEVREDAATALGKIGSDKATARLIEKYNELDWDEEGVELAWRVVEALGNIGSDTSVSIMLDAIKNPYYYVRAHAVHALGKFSNDRAAHVLPNLLTLASTKFTEEALEALAAIQANCQFYNYEIFCSDPVPEDIPLSQAKTIFNIETLNANNSALNLGGVLHNNQNDTKNNLPPLIRLGLAVIFAISNKIRRSVMNNNTFNIGNFNADKSAVNLGGTVEGDQIGTQAIDASDPEMRSAITDLQSLISQLQTQHPHITNETQALDIIDAEFTEIKQDKTQYFSVKL